MNNSGKMITDKKAIMLAIQKDSFALQYASEELRNDKEVVIAAISQNLYELRYASDKLKADKEVIMTAIKKCPFVLEHVSDELKNDKEIVMEAIRKSPCMLCYASDELKNDKEVVMLAIDENPYALEYASEEIRNNISALIDASVINKYPNTLKFASEELKNNKEVVIAAVKKCPRVLEYVSEELKNDKEVVMTAIKEKPYILKYASDKLKSDKNLQLLKYELRFASDLIQKLKKDYYNAYKTKIVLQDSSKDNDFDFLNVMLNSNVLQQIYESRQYTINDCLFLDVAIRQFDFKNKNSINQRIKEYIKIYLKYNINIYNQFCLAVDSDEKFDSCLKKYNLNKDNITDFVINNKYYSNEVKQSFINIINRHYKENYTSVMDIFNMLNEMVEYEMTLEQILKIKNIKRKVFDALYKKSLNDNPILHDFIEDKLKLNRIRGMKKFYKKGYAILNYKAESIEEINDIFGEDVYTILKDYEKTELYNKLYIKFSKLIGFEITNKENKAIR